jgi:alpha-tubulin suppressor-like RCC1 family protein
MKSFLESKSKTNISKVKTIKNISTYSPISDNDILTVNCTDMTIFVLLNTGTLLSWGKNNAAIGRYCLNVNTDSYIPKPVKSQIPIIDITCGVNHCLARGTNFKVYSWGYNLYGQVIIIS